MPTLPDDAWYSPRYRRLPAATLGAYTLLAAHACSCGSPIVSASALTRIGVTARRREHLLDAGLVTEHPDGLELLRWDELYALTRRRKYERARKRRYRARLAASREPAHESRGSRASATVPGRRPGESVEPASVERANVHG